MGYSREVRNSAMIKIEERRLNAEREAEYTKQRIYKELPDAEALEKAIAACGISAGRAVLKGGNVKEELEKLRAKSLELQEKYKQVLANAGYSVEATEPQYVCKRCNDRGYVEADNRTIMCDCLKQVLAECACAELNRNSPLSLCTFDDFNLDYYSDTPPENSRISPKKQMSSIYNYCVDYAKNFTSHSNSIFMTGKTGLGKTHLSLSIANEVIKKGYGVIYVSAPSMVSTLEKEHFSYNKDSAKTEDALLDCDLLIIDDLGTEFTTQFTASAIYNIFNSRLLANKPVIVNTNLSIQELEKLYSQRIVSRIIGQTVRLDFLGKDIRIIKK